MYFEDGGWGHEPRRARGLEKLKKTTDKTLFEAFVNYLTINVSEFYRNPEQWAVLDKEVFPRLIKKFGKNLKIWISNFS